MFDISICLEVRRWRLRCTAEFGKYKIEESELQEPASSLGQSCTKVGRCTRRGKRQILYEKDEYKTYLQVTCSLSVFASEKCCVERVGVVLWGRKE
jgi:hypothetical protein